MKKIIAFILSLACLSSLSCFAMDTEPTEEPAEAVSITTLAEASPELRAKAEADLVEIFGHMSGGIQTASLTDEGDIIQDEDKILILDYVTHQEGQYEVETILYVDQTRASSGTVGGASAHRYNLAGTNLFTVHAYSYFTYDGTAVSPDRSSRDCWCSSSSVNFSITSWNYSPESGSTCGLYYNYTASTTGIDSGAKTISIICTKTGNVTTQDQTYRY